ncbi:hypothetical protein PISMIDRAFT_202276 [Pisolithus microcarpus 441]|uniref:Uncharacterized protein n=1 Tax=Pisolithus microcarpus 441 TaxID=765257 RepID=A0A0C9ZD46_9AGAM|nr:hypothetical protein PISMIDRAFT_202276 [Pisolithus microcarpus 441]
MRYAPRPYPFPLERRATWYFARIGESHGCKTNGWTYRMGESIREEHTGSSFVLSVGLPHKDSEHVAESRVGNQIDDKCARRVDLVQC